MRSIRNHRPGSSYLVGIAQSAVRPYSYRKSSANLAGYQASSQLAMKSYERNLFGNFHYLHYYAGYHNAAMPAPINTGFYTNHANDPWSGMTTEVQEDRAPTAQQIAGRGPSLDSSITNPPGQAFTSERNTVEPFTRPVLTKMNEVTGVENDEMNYANEGTGYIQRLIALQAEKGKVQQPAPLQRGEYDRNSSNPSRTESTQPQSMQQVLTMLSKQLEMHNFRGPVEEDVEIAGNEAWANRSGQLRIPGVTQEKYPQIKSAGQASDTESHVPDTTEKHVNAEVNRQRVPSVRRTTGADVLPRQSSRVIQNKSMAKPATTKNADFPRETLPRIKRIDVQGQEQESSKQPERARHTVTTTTITTRVNRPVDTEANLHRHHIGQIGLRIYK